MYQSKISNIIIRLKKAKNNDPEVTLQKISDQTGISMSTVTRIFSDGSENQSFRYDSLKPICLMLSPHQSEMGTLTVANTMPKVWLLSSRL